VNIWDKIDAEEDVPLHCNTCSVSSMTGYCDNCFRTLKEILEWSDMSSDAKRHVIEEIKKRKKKLNAI